MDVVVVVKTGIFGLGGVKVAVEGVDFLADLEDQVSLQEGVEVLRVLGARLGEHLLVDELVDWTTLHGGQCRVLFTWSVVVVCELYGGRCRDLLCRSGSRILPSTK